jgi:Major Facilitator Superfamily.
VTLRIVPFLMVCYFISFLDRVNLGFAALQMVEDLHFSATVFGFGAGIFFLSYFLFEVPSNLLLEKFGARRWIARIMITGACSPARWRWSRVHARSISCGFCWGPPKLVSSPA